MSNPTGLAAAARLSEATRVAKASPHTDINSTVRQCQASARQIFVVPVRYALSEEPAGHPASQPGVEPQSHPMAARLLRTGFVYVWQGRGPLQRYAVALNKWLCPQALSDDDTVIEVGSLSGVALDKHQEAWMLYSEIPLNPSSCQQLKEPEVRAKRMRYLDLRQVANTLQAPHCVPLTEARQVMAELIPSTYDLALAIDYQRNQTTLRKSADELGDLAFKAATPINIKAYTDAMRWLGEREKVAAHYPPVPAEVPPPGAWSAVPWAPGLTQQIIESGHTQARGLYSVLACLDDDLGVLRDINHEQELLESRHEQWQADNKLRLSIGGFIRSLISEDGAELAGNLSYRYREHEIELTPEQGRTLLKTHHRLEELFKEEVRINQQRGGLYGNKEADALLRKVHADVQAAVAPVRGFIPPELHTEVESVIRDYRAEKIANLENHHASVKVEQYIDLPAMNQWLDITAPAHFTHVQQRHEALFIDRGLYLPRHHSGTWSVDYSDPDHREWLDKLAVACLSGQCLRKQGAGQYADYVRSPDDGALRQLFFGWIPSLEGAVNSTSRAGELIAALGVENQANAKQAIVKVLGVLNEPLVTSLAQRAQDTNGHWNILIKRLGAALMLLQGEHTSVPSGPWLGILVAARLGCGVGLRTISEGGTRVWQLFGSHAENLTRWANTMGKAIAAGQVKNIVNSSAVQGAGGLVAVTALLLNSWNAGIYLAQAGALEGMDKQRSNDTISATLYAGAALVAVIDSHVRGKDANRVFAVKFPYSAWTAAPALTLFGALIGGFSAVAALYEFRSLQIQIENSHSTLDPWLNIRHDVVGGQLATYGAMGLAGIYYTARALAGTLTAEAAMAGFSLWMGPLSFLLAVLGVLYLIAWFLQQTPMQNFLNYCCWSKARASDLGPLSFAAQQQELSKLYNILYAPRVSFVGRNEPKGTSSHMGLLFASYIDSVTIDLPGAEPNGVYLELSMIGNPRDTLAMRERVKNGEGVYRAEEPMQDIADCWLHGSRCEWIPYAQGKGLRLTGAYAKEIKNLFASQPTKVSLRLRYQTPLTSMLGALSFIGGEHGMAFTLSESAGVVALRDDPTPALDRAKRYVLGGQQCSVYLQPGLKP